MIYLEWVEARLLMDEEGIGKHPIYFRVPITREDVLLWLDLTPSQYQRGSRLLRDLRHARALLAAKKSAEGLGRLEQKDFSAFEELETPVSSEFNLNLRLTKDGTALRWSMASLKGKCAYYSSHMYFGEKVVFDCILPLFRVHSLHIIPSYISM